MRIIGISLRKNELYYSVIEGEKQSNTVLIDSAKIRVRNYESIPELMNWFDSNFRELITRFKPDCVAYKLHLNTKMDQMTYLQFPFGILNLICHNEGISATPRSTRYITDGRKTRANNYFSKYKEKIKDAEIDALVVAWDELER